MRLEEQCEDRMMQFRMHQQLMMTMMMMMGGRYVLVQTGMNTQQPNIPNISPMQSPNDNDDGNNEEHMEVGQEGKE